MPRYDAASLATPAAVSHEGRLSVATGSQRRGNFICRVKALTLRGQLFERYLFAKIATTLSFSSRRSWPWLPRFRSLRWALLFCFFFPGSGGGVRGGGGTWKLLCFIGCIGFHRPPSSRVGKGQSRFSLWSPEAFKFLLPFRKGAPFFLQEPSVIQWKDRNNFKLPGLYKLYWEWKLVGAPCGVCDYGSYNAHLSCWAVLVCALLAAEVIFYFFYIYIYLFIFF